jgi:uncharacterized protein YdgA (DUF945 family)
VKKSVIALILLTVLVIIVSPAIVGKFAEESVGENLNWAASESGGELIVTSEGFDRGWFSSEGQHRVELGDGQVRAAMATAGSDGEMPVLLINTHIDHGLIPVTSMAREKGSLAPGLGSAVSTLTIETGDGKTVDLPGTIYSELGLSGNLASRYVVDAGTRIIDDGEITWQPTTINIVSSARTGDIEFGGDLGAMTFGNEQQIVSIDSLSFKGEKENTPYGFHVGTVEIEMGEMAINANGMPVSGMQGMNVEASSSVDDGVAKADMHFEMSGQTIPGFGDVSVIANLEFEDLDAAALGAVSGRLEELAGSQQDPTMMMMSAEEELKDLVAGGLSLEIDQFDVALPMGTVEFKMDFEIPKSDRTAFVWTSLLLETVASIDIVVPEALIQLATSMNPEAGAIIGMGYLKKEGDFYILDADFKKGLLTVNGAPIPIPMGAFQ